MLLKLFLCSHFSSFSLFSVTETSFDFTTARENLGQWRARHAVEGRQIGILSTNRKRPLASGEGGGRFYHFFRFVKEIEYPGGVVRCIPVRCIAVRCIAVRCIALQRVAVQRVVV